MTIIFSYEVDVFSKIKLLCIIGGLNDIVTILNLKYYEEYY